MNFCKHKTAQLFGHPSALEKLVSMHKESISDHTLINFFRENGE